MFNTYLILC